MIKESDFKEAYKRISQLKKQYPNLRRAKDQEFIDSTIKIRKIRQTFKSSKGTYHYVDYLLCVEIKKHWGNKVLTCFPDTKKGRKELLEFIKEECYL